MCESSKHKGVLGDSMGVTCGHRGLSTSLGEHKEACNLEGGDLEDLSLGKFVSI